MTKDFKVIRLTKLKELGLEEEFVREIIETFIHEIPQYINQATDAVMEGNKDNLKRILHTLKSHSKTLGMSEVLQKLAYWEKNIHEKTLNDFNPDFAYIKQKWTEAVEDLESLSNREHFI